MNANYLSLAVVIPCYNNSSTLERAIISVLNQTRLPDEIIVVDDLSDDPDIIDDIISKYSTARLIRNKINLGVAASRNVGIYGCNSDIITFLDADDECNEFRFEIQLKAVEIHTVSTCKSINPNDKIPKKINNNYKVNNNTNYFKFMIYNRFVGAALMAHVSLLKKVGGYDPKLRSSEDYDLYLRLLSCGYVVAHVKENLYYYNDTENSLSKNTPFLMQSQLYSVCKLIKSKNGQKYYKLWRFVITLLILSRSMLTLDIKGFYNIKINQIIISSCVSAGSLPAIIVGFLYELRVFRILGKIIYYISFFHRKWCSINSSTCFLKQIKTPH